MTYAAAVFTRAQALAALARQMTDTDSDGNLIGTPEQIAAWHDLANIAPDLVQLATDQATALQDAKAATDLMAAQIADMGAALHRTTGALAEARAHRDQLAQIIERALSPEERTILFNPTLDLTPRARSPQTEG